MKPDKHVIPDERRGMYWRIGPEDRPLLILEASQGPTMVMLWAFLLLWCYIGGSYLGRSFGWWA